MVRLRQYGETYSKIVGFVKRRPGALFVGMSIVLMVATAVSIATDQKELADTIVQYAFLILVIAIGLEIASLR